VGPDVVGHDQRGAAPPGAAPAVLELRRISKAFPGQVALDDVSLSVRSGEIHALVGENGAGKTTLVKILAGTYTADSGEVLLDGRPVQISHPWEAAALGLAFIHQDPTLFPALSVAENLALGLGYRRNWARLVSWRDQWRLAREALAEVGLEVDPRVPLDTLTQAERQLVALVRVVHQRHRVVVLDEVTAPLSYAEVERLFQIVRGMRQAGTAVIYISHRLEEIFDLADRVTVLRNGAVVATHPVAELEPAALARLIIGKDPTGRFAEAVPSGQDRVVLAAHGLSDELLEDVSFELRAGEILGLAGLAGAGRTNLLEILFGARQAAAGQITLDGAPLEPRHPADAIARGVALVTEDRQRDGYAPDLPVWQTVTLPWLRRYQRSGLLSLGRERRVARDVVTRFDVRAASVEARMQELSGGNQQKVILGRWLTQPLRVLLLDEPTHGVDVGAKEEIYRIVRDLAARGVAVILASSELEELEGLCARVLLLSEGRVIGELRGDDIDKPTILAALLARRLPEDAA
jgi:ABC-type sugar transport system ATPase subunit